MRQRHLSRKQTGRNAKQSSGSDVIAKSADENDAENLFTDTIIINALNTLRKYLVEQKTGEESEVVSESEVSCVLNTEALVQKL